MAFNVRNTNPRAITRVLEEASLQHEIVKLQNVRIPLKDGVELQAHIWIPKEALENNLKVGTLVEYIPYRTDVTVQRDQIRHTWYAGNGLSSIRIDMRGSSASDGVLTDEYLKIEQDDALECFDWITKQTWSNGNIGMFGKSWGGFNGLQVAARQHPALKTIITLMSTDDRYTDDVHYRGGCLLASDMLWWGSTMSVYAPRPQDPKVVGPSWKSNWLERLNVEPMVKNWVEHQTRDDYWKHGSINEDYSKVDIPVLAVGGWRDGYTSPVFRIVDNLPHPETAGLVGPWVHEYPEMAEPAPKIGYQQLSLKWFKKYLDPETAEDKDFKLPKLTAYVQDPSGISDSYTFREGKWVSLKDPREKKSTSLFLAENNKLSNDPSEVEYDVSGVLSHGTFRGTYCPFGFKGDFPADQRLEDSKCLTFDSEVFEQEMDLLGEPVLSLTFSSDKKLANLSAKLVDIYPDNGENVLISWGQLNLTHRESDEFPEFLNPGEKYDVDIKLDVLGISVKKGHKLRVSLSTADWPQNWPTPEIPTLKLYKGEIKLPLLNESQVVASPIFEQATIMRGIETEVVKAHDRIKTTSYDYSNDQWTLTDIQDSGIVKLPKYAELSGIYHGSWNKNEFRVKANDPLSAYNVNYWTYDMGRDEDDWRIKLESESSLSADKDNFFLKVHLKALENEKEVFEKSWDYSIPRQFI
jgi:putative CocE/NonD family hydrolase